VLRRQVLLEQRRGASQDDALPLELVVQQKGAPPGLVPVPVCEARKGRRSKTRKDKIKEKGRRGGYLEEEKEEAE